MQRMFNIELYKWNSPSARPCVCVSRIRLWIRALFLLKVSNFRTDIEVLCSNIITSIAATTYYSIFINTVTQTHSASSIQEISSLFFRFEYIGLTFMGFCNFQRHLRVSLLNIVYAFKMKFICSQVKRKIYKWISWNNLSIKNMMTTKNKKKNKK